MATTLVIILIAAAAVAVSALAGAVVDVGGRPAAASDIDTSSSTPRHHVARSGDTLWSIADSYRGDVGRDRYIDALIDLNGGTRIQVGQAIRLP